MLTDAIELLKLINENGYEAYIVGGFVRDHLMGNNSNDIDITTNATPMEIRKMFSDAKITHDEYGSVTVIYCGIRYEITTYRKEFKYKNNRIPDEFEYVDKLEEDLERRDFTINAISMDKDGNIIDLFNGRDDIERKIINTIGNASLKFEQDVLRILRAIRFATQLNFKLSEEVKKAIIENKYLLKKLSYNRKKEELDKIFASANVNYGVKLLKELDLLEILDISKLDNIYNYNNILAIWAVIDEGKYPFTKAENEQIKNIKEVIKLDIIDRFVLYKYGLYICMIVGELKGINKKLITEIYNNLPIKSKKDICITGSDIIDILDIKPSHIISEIYAKIEIEILHNRLDNNYQTIKEYIKNNYEII